MGLKAICLLIWTADWTLVSAQTGKESSQEKVHAIVSTDGTTIAYERVGSGPPLILVDGALCYRAFGPTAGLAPLLASRFTVYRYDRRGRGQSSDTKPYAVEREIEDLEALIKEAGGTAFVCGLSSGAVLAAEAAARGVKIQRLALFEPPFEAVDNPGRRLPPGAAAQLVQLASSGRRSDAVEFFLTKVAGLSTEAIASVRKAPVWPAMEAVAHTLAYDVMILGDSRIPVERLRSVRVPTLVIDGERSPESLRLAVQAVVSALPKARRHYTRIDAATAILGFTAQP